MNPILLSTIAALAAASTAATAAPFTPGSLVIERVGDGAAALSSAATPIFLEERAFTGNLLQSIPLPTSVNSLTAAGSSTAEGLLNRSADGRFLTVPGYDAASGTAAVAGTTSSTVLRSTGELDSSGTLSLIDLTASPTNPFSGANFRSVISSDGSNFWAAGSANGIYYFNSTGASTLVSSSSTNNRAVEIFGGQLFSSSAAGSFAGVSAVGTGLPTVSGSTFTLTIATGTGSSPYDFFLADLSPAVAGLDTAWIADDRGAATGGGIQRYNFDGSAWTLAYTLSTGTTGVRGLTASLSGSTAQLFATTTETNANRLISIFDLGDKTTSDLTLATLATAGALTAFRGVDFAPVPEPAAFGCVALGAALLSMTQRARRKVRA